GREEGQANRRRVDQAVAEAFRGKQEQGVLAEMEKARTALTYENRFGRGRFENIARGVLGGITGVRAEQQAINERALMDLSARAERLGIPTVPSGLRSPDGRPFSADVKCRSPAAVNAEIMGWLARIAAATEKANERDERRANPPLAAPPPRPAGRM